MNDSGNINHLGIVKSISGNTIRVENAPDTACTSCEVSGSCVVSSTDIKIVDVETVNNNYTIGQQVEVILSEKQGAMAMFLAYVFPFILMFIVMLMLSRFTSNEAIIGLVSLGSLIPYYLILFLLRNRVKSNFGFRLGKPVNIGKLP